jgi:MSHA biogenesis protein MshI
MKLEWPFRKRAGDGWLAASIGEGRARFAHVKPGARPAVAFLEERSWDAADHKALERHARSLGAHGLRCTTLLAPAEYQILLVEAPNVKREELKSAVRWRIKDLIEFHVDDATLDVLDIPVRGAPSQRQPSMYVVVARNDTVRGVMQRFDEARIPLGVIDIPDTAQRNIASLYEPQDKALLAISFDAGGGLITVTAGGELYVSRRLDLTYAQVNAGPPAQERAFDRVLLEVQRSLDHFERNIPELAVAQVRVAPMAEAPALVKHLAAQLYLPVEAMELAEVMDLPESYGAAAPEKRADWFRLIGAGLRVEKAVL